MAASRHSYLPYKKKTLSSTQADVAQENVQHNQQEAAANHVAKKRAEKTYQNVAKRQLMEDLSEHERKDMEIKKYEQLLDRLYNKPHSHTEIMTGIFKDQKAIAKAIEINRLQNRFCEASGVREERKLKHDDNAQKKSASVAIRPEEFEETVDEKAMA